MTWDGVGVLAARVAVQKRPDSDYLPVLAPLWFRVVYHEFCLSVLCKPVGCGTLAVWGMCDCGGFGD